MTDHLQLRQQLISKTDLEWFDCMCEILKKESKPTVNMLMDIIGTESPNPNHQIRGSKILDSFDKRFGGVSMNPDLQIGEADQPLDYLSFWGGNFKISIGDIAERFRDFKTQTNTYDGGTQIFFHPVSGEYEFTAINCWTEKDSDKIDAILDLEVNSVTFNFGDQIVLGRDGYSMKRPIH